MELNGAAIVAETLISHGITDIFGFPGGAVLNLYDELYLRKDKLNHILTSHEQGACHAADGYSRASGKVGVVISTSGPGATNLVTGIANAYLDSTPIVAITGNVARALSGKDSFQEVDICGITTPITKKNYHVENIKDLEPILCDAFKVARSGRPGPVLIDIPKDIQAISCEFHGGKPLFAGSDETFSAENIIAAAELIANAENPYIYAGGGVVIAGAYKELSDFAEKIDAPIGFSIMGLTAMDYRNPRNLGMTGMHGTYQSVKMNAEADLIIGIGVRFSDRATGNIDKYREKAKVIHIDIDESEISKNVPCDAEIIGDIKDILPLLTAKVKQCNDRKWHEKSREFSNHYNSQGNHDYDFSPKHILEKIREFTSDDTVVATDVGQHQMWTAQFYKFSNPRTFLTSGGLGTMGFGMGAAIGAAVAQKQKTVLITGDGSFHMNLNELATAVKYNIPIVVVIMNNGVLGMVRQWQRLFYNEHFSQTTLNRQTDYLKLADAFGAKGYRACNISELSNALTTAFSENGPCLIDCHIDPDERVLPMIPPGGSAEDIMIN